MSPVAVYPWPLGVDRAVDALRSSRGMAVISIDTPVKTIRDVARDLVHVAVRQTLGAYLYRPAESVVLISRVGQPLRVQALGGYIGLSVSHEAGMSIAAIRVRGDVGVDIMRSGRGDGFVGGDSLLPSSVRFSGLIPDWEIVARNYLGDAACDRIGTAMPEDRSLVFAREWTRFEAALKSRGNEMTEWSPALARKLGECEVAGLVLPDSFVGSIAIV